MKTIIIIMFCCWIIYKTGAAGRFLELFKIRSGAPPDTAAQETPPTRQQLEAHAIYILESRGLSTNNVKYMTDKLLIEIIQEYYAGR